MYRHCDEQDNMVNYALTETMSSGLSLGSSGLGVSAGNVSTRALRASMGMEAA